MSKKDLKSQIKEMEAKKREETMQIAQAEIQVTFDSWYHQRKHLIPKCHHKEILVADFSARDLGNEATMGAYDKALELYGVKLK